MSLCQACHSLFSRRHIEVFKEYQVRPSAPNFTKGLETSTGNQACSFCSYLWTLLSKPIDPQYGTQATRSEGVGFGYYVWFHKSPYPLLTSNGRKEVGLGQVTVFGYQGVREHQTLFFIPKSRTLLSYVIDMDRALSYFRLVRAQYRWR